MNPMQSLAAMAPRNATGAAGLPTAPAAAVSLEGAQPEGMGAVRSTDFTAAVVQMALPDAVLPFSSATTASPTGEEPTQLPESEDLDADALALLPSFVAVWAEMSSAPVPHRSEGADQVHANAMVPAALVPPATMAAVAAPIAPELPGASGQAARTGASVVAPRVQDVAVVAQAVTDGLTRSPAPTEVQLAALPTWQEPGAVAGGAKASSGGASPDAAPAKAAQPLLQALSQRIQLQHAQGMDVVTVRLDPPQLGTLEVRIQHDQAGVQVLLQASHAEVGRQLAGLAEGLRQELQARTNGEASVVVAQGRQPGGSTGQGGQPRDTSSQWAYADDEEIGQALQAWQLAADTTA